MSVELSQYQGNLTAQLQEAPNNTSVAEAQAGLAADGTSAAPEGSVPVVVEPGDTVSDMMANYGLSYPEDVGTFYEMNPQFDPSNPQRRNEDLIYVGEVLYMPAPGGTAGQPNEPVSAPTHAEAAAATDEAVANIEQQQNAEYPPGLQHEQQDAIHYANQQFFDAAEAEIEAGLNEYMQANPEATPEQISAEADRLKHGIQSRSSTAAGMDDASMDYRTQQAVNSASANQYGVDLETVHPSTQINDGPYTDTSGPFEPNAQVQLRDGTYIQTDENGFPDTDTDNNGVADPTTSAQAAPATDAAAQSLHDAQNMQLPPELEHERINAVSDATTQLGNAVQQEVEVGLREFIAENPDATRDEIEAHADQLMHGIRAREGNDVITDSQADYRGQAAVDAVIGEE